MLIQFLRRERLLITGFRLQGQREGRLIGKQHGEIGFVGQTRLTVIDLTAHTMLNNRDGGMNCDG